METSKIKGIENGRAEFAYKCVEEGSKIKNCKEYKSYSKKIPTLIKTNGLGSTFAFIKSRISEDKSEKGYAYYLLYTQTFEWLKKDEKQLIALNDNDKLIQRIVEMPPDRYRAVTNEVIAFFMWLRRFSEGLIEGEENNEG